MAVTIEHRAPQVRCYECGSSAVRQFCHHCWRPGCSRHVTPSPAWTQRLSGAEGGGPGLKKVRAAHCADHTHSPKGIWLVTGACGLALTAAGLFSLIVSYIAGVSVVAVGAATVLTVYAGVRRGAVQSRTSLPVALHPKVS